MAINASKSLSMVSERMMIWQWLNCSTCVSCLLFMVQVAGLALRSNYAFIDTVGEEEADTNIQVGHLYRRRAAVLLEGWLLVGGSGVVGRGKEVPCGKCGSLLVSKLRSMHIDGGGVLLNGAPCMPIDACRAQHIPL